MGKESDRARFRFGVSFASGVPDPKSAASKVPSTVEGADGGEQIPVSVQYFTISALNEA